MARTKRGPKPKVPELKSSNNLKIKEVALQKLKEEEEKVMKMLDKRMQEELQQLDIEFSTLRAKFPIGMLNRTIAEIKNGEVCDSQLSVTMVLSDLTNTFNSTTQINSTSANIKKGKSHNVTNSTVSSSSSSDLNKTRVITTSKPRILRSMSAGCDDEGYTTAESSRATNSGGKSNTTRQSRSRTKNRLKPASRSLSRTTKNASTYKTPVNRQPRTSSVGTITPKCKANTPLLYVRRPKVGEVAWSNQGSPLLVSTTVAPEQTANVNIPINGDILSMLPCRGAMRQSQIPDVDEDTRKQLEILRDNLIKVCNTINK